MLLGYFKYRRRGNVRLEEYNRRYPIVGRARTKAALPRSAVKRNHACVLKFTHDSKRLFVLIDNAIVCLDATTGRQLAVFRTPDRGPYGRPRYFDTDKAEKYVLIGDLEGAVYVWNLRSLCNKFALPSRDSPRDERCDS